LNSAFRLKSLITANTADGSARISTLAENVKDSVATRSSYFISGTGKMTPPKRRKASSRVHMMFKA
jgi:hypothetical protein